MKAICILKLEYDSDLKAKKIMNATKVDNYEFVNSKLDKNHIKIRIECKSVSSLLHTLDDYLACISIAEKIVKQK